MEDKWLESDPKKSYYDAIMGYTYETMVDVEIISYCIEYISLPDVYDISLEVNGVIYSRSIDRYEFDSHKSGVLWFVLNDAACYIYGTNKNHYDKLKTVYNHMMDGNKYGKIYCPKTYGHVEWESKKKYAYGGYISDPIVFNFESSAFKGKKNTEQSLSSLSQELPGMYQIEIHPVTKTHEFLRNIIMSLNDRYRWSRDQIADWIETLENVPTFKTKEKE